MVRAVARPDLDYRELDRYVQRVDDRWKIQRVIVGGARVDDASGVGSQRERGPEWVVIFVSEHFDGVPWLERVHQAGSLWDAMEMGGAADVHCYTAAEFERRREQLPVVRAAVQRGVEITPARTA